MGDDVGGIFKSIGSVAMGIGGAILGSVLLPGLGTGLGAAAGMGLGAAGGAAGGALGTLAGEGIFKQRLPSGSNLALSAGLGALGGGLGQAFKGVGGGASIAKAGGSAGSSASKFGLMGGQTLSAGSAAPYMSTAEMLAATPTMAPQMIQAAGPTTKQLVYQGLLTGAVPAAATLGAGMLARRDTPEEKTYTYKGGARSYTDLIRQRRAERAARKQALGI